MADEADDKTQAPEPEVEIIETDEQGNPPADQHADDDHDDRLAGSQDDYDEDVTGQGDGEENPARKRRVKRRELQRRARDKSEQELAYLRQHAGALEQRLAALEGNALQSTEQNYRGDYDQALAEIRTAEQVIAKATEAGNGEDVVAAMRIRDAAIYRAQQAEYGYNQLQGHRQQQQAPQAPAQPQLDPDTQRYANEWLQANPWYNPAGDDEDSAIATAIEQSMARQGYDPSTRAYWRELTRRVSDRIGGEEDAGQRRAVPVDRRGPPPQGLSRGGGGAPGTRKETYFVTPERKAAMVEAGIWDDVPRRNQMLKQYAEYDRNHSASR